MLRLTRLTILGIARRLCLLKIEILATILRFFEDIGAVQ